MKVGEDKYIERKEVIDSVTGKLYVYQRTVTTSHYETKSYEPNDNFDPESVSESSDPETHSNLVNNAATARNPVTRDGVSSYQTVTRTKWNKFGPYTIGQ